MVVQVNQVLIFQIYVENFLDVQIKVEGQILVEHMVVHKVIQ